MLQHHLTTTLTLIISNSCTKTKIYVSLVFLAPRRKQGMPLVSLEGFETVHFRHYSKSEVQCAQHLTISYLDTRKELRSHHLSPSGCRSNAF